MQNRPTMPNYIRTFGNFWRISNMFKKTQFQFYYMYNFHNSYFFRLYIYIYTYRGPLYIYILPGAERTMGLFDNLAPLGRFGVSLCFGRPPTPFDAGRWGQARYWQTLAEAGGEESLILWQKKGNKRTPKVSHNMNTMYKQYKKI